MDIILKSKAKLIRGYPSSIYIFTKLLKEENLFIENIQHISTSSETLLPNWRKEIEAFWGVPVHDYYGLNERTVVVQQCWAGNYHNSDDYGLLELDENNQIISTSLHNTVQPFVRYATGDIAVPLDNESIGTCKCGRTLSIPFKAIQGRSDDLLFKTDGTVIPVVNIYTFMGDSNYQIRQYKIVQKSLNSILVYVVMNQEYELDEERLIGEFKSRLGENMDIKFIKLGQISRDENSGKIKTIVNEASKYEKY